MLMQTKKYVCKKQKLCDSPAKCVIFGIKSHRGNKIVPHRRLEHGPQTDHMTIDVIGDLAASVTPIVAHLIPPPLTLTADLRVSSIVATDGEARKLEDSITDPFLSANLYSLPSPSCFYISVLISVSRISIIYFPFSLASVLG